MRNKIKPIDHNQFHNFFFCNEKNETENYFDFYNDTIESLKKVAISPYFWFISSLSEMKIKVLSDNIEQFTPVPKQQWLDSSTHTDFFGLFHPDDQYYLLGAFEFAARLVYVMDDSQLGHLRFNFYSRMLDKNKNYRWILLQSPLQQKNEKKEIQSSLVIIYDLSHFQIINKPLLSIIDFSNNEIQYFKHFDHDIKQIDVNKPTITKREKEILKLMAMGQKTPEIAASLFISYHTVENHKRNLRRKTNTKTSSELIAYTMTHSLLLI